ncbi:MAG: hypothetical protein QGD94_02625 [Planctomycetia bacterium]|nr:hypothetical protein [Planctomycetia bacterium]
MKIEPLSQYVLDGLGYLVEQQEQDKLPRAPDLHRPTLVVGSGNAYYTGRIIYGDQSAIFADQDEYHMVYASLGSARGLIEDVIIISASGEKDAAVEAKFFAGEGIKPILITCNPNAPAADFARQTLVFPSRDEPPTYNVSTYLGILLGRSGESAAEILETIQALVIPEDIADHDAYFMLIPNRLKAVSGLFNVKYREIFGANVYGKAASVGDADHGLFVNEAQGELVINLGVENDTWGASRLDVPLPQDVGPGLLMAAGYYVIGKTQEKKHPWFAESIMPYIEKRRLYKNRQGDANW